MERGGEGRGRGEGGGEGRGGAEEREVERGGEGQRSRGKERREGLEGGGEKGGVEGRGGERGGEKGRGETEQGGGQKGCCTVCTQWHTESTLHTHSLPPTPTHHMSQLLTCEGPSQSHQMPGVSPGLTGSAPPAQGTDRGWHSSGIGDRVGTLDSDIR